MNKVQSIEPQIADKFNNELRSYNLDYKLEQESLNKKIDEALKNYASKSGGLGGNRPDVKLLLNTQDPNRRVPILIEYKGLKDKLIKLDKNKLVENFKNHEPHYKNIREYALNGALHYANAILHHTSYTECIAIGITGYKDDKGDIRSQIAVYYVNKSNLGMGVDVSKGEQGYNDLSFLSRKHFKATSKSITDTHNIPLVYCKKGNNGIMYWGKKGDFETYNNIISIIYNGVIATGLTYAHRDEVGILAESYFIKFKNGNPNFLCNLFIKTAIEKVLYPKYSRDNLATWANKVENELILLPTNQHGKIDFHFMHILINALMKQAIQGVAQYCDAKIQATKEAISQETPIQKDSLF